MILHTKAVTVTHVPTRETVTITNQYYGVPQRLMATLGHGGGTYTVAYADYTSTGGAGMTYSGLGQSTYTLSTRRLQIGF